MNPALTLSKSSSQSLIFWSPPYRFLAPFFFGGMGAKTNLDSASSSYFLIQTFLNYSLYSLFSLPFLSFIPQPRANLRIPFSWKSTNNIHAAKSIVSFVLIVPSISIYFELPGRMPDKWIPPSWLQPYRIISKLPNRGGKPSMISLTPIYLIKLDLPTQSAVSHLGVLAQALPSVEKALPRTPTPAPPF